MSKVKRNKFDVCNICRKKKDLSWDHVPPKGGIILNSLEIEGIFHLISGHEKGPKTISQNGVKYRTICSNCNAILGHEFDTELNKLNESLISFLQSSTKIPKSIKFRVKPIRIMKSVLAHLIAAKHNIDNVLTDKLIRESIFSNELSIPDNLHIHFWVYPYDCTIIMRDFAIPTKEGRFSEFTIANMIKYFPLAFIVTDKKNFRGLESLSKYRKLDIDDEVDLKINLRNLKGWDWPTKVDNNNIVVMSAETQNGIFAKPRK